MGVVGGEGFVEVAIVEFLEEVAEGVFDFVWGGGDVYRVEFFEELSDGVGGGGEGGVTEVVDAVGEGVAFDFFVDGEGAFLFVVVEGHLRGVEAGFATDVVAEFGVFDDHFGEEGVAGEAEEEVAIGGGDFDDYVGPAGEDVAGVCDFVAFERGFDDAI